MPNFFIMHLTITSKTLIYDLLTPVNLYLKLRDLYTESFLLESSDYSSSTQARSFIGLKSIASFSIEKGSITEDYQGLKKVFKTNYQQSPISDLQKFIQSFSAEDHQKALVKFFGHTSYDAVRYFEDIHLEHADDCIIPELSYHLFQFVIQIDHYNNTLTIHEYLPEGKSSRLTELLEYISSNETSTHSFKTLNSETSNLSNKDFKNLVSKGKSHCKTGDVFQIVLSRQFSQEFKGDEFNVYRALRSVNPSPYLFYFDYGHFKIFGSSPEAQLKIADGKAILNPIAGTYKRTGNPEFDKQEAERLKEDSKENAEHSMLVDLARNDLSKHGKQVTIKNYKSIQYYSHVIHMVSEIEAEINTEDALHIFADTFPAGTLSGAPKYKAIQLIDQYENQSRGFYGGAIGYFGLDGSINQAITIRSFLSKENTLYSQAGAGIVIDSNEENELAEVNNKLGALKKALSVAQTL